jgi:hypothetical protein
MLSADKIKSNWDHLIHIIESRISSPRSGQLIDLYSKFESRIMMMPAYHKKEYHNSFPGGYVDHILRVIDCALDLDRLWEKYGAITSTYTQEELVFAALNHDLGKIGTETHESYIPQTDQWRKEKLGEDYKFNDAIPYASVSDRGLFILQSYGIKYSFNEMIAIQTHDGLYDEGNKKYLITYLPEQKPRTCLPFIIHQADLMASRIEFEKEWLPKLIKSESKEETKSNFKLTNPPPSQVNEKTKKDSIKMKALSSVKSEGLKNFLSEL